MTGKAAVYRLYDVDGTLLYVGMTSNLASRWRQHAADKPWWHEVVRQNVTWYPSRDEASDHEQRAITDEFPRHNIMQPPWRTPVAARPIDEAMANRVRSSRHAYDTALQEQADAQAEIRTAIVEALDAGVKQADLVRVTGYTRERIRQIRKAAERDGRPPAKS